MNHMVFLNKTSCLPAYSFRKKLLIKLPTTKYLHKTHDNDIFEIKIVYIPIFPKPLS